ncbi:hypothetical protein MKW94_004296, partial [Papaver nudicaule]|nr:hypothetical protein [Papaver nudicaule]
MSHKDELLLELLKISSVLLTTAFEGKLQQLKKVASEIDGILGVGLPTILGNTKDRDGRRAIHLAAAKGRVNVLKYLGCKCETPLCRATVEGRASAVEYLLRMGANPEISTYDNMHPLHLAAQKGHKDVITLLLSKCINIDVSNNFGSPLQFACAYGQHDTVELLLHQNANVSSIHFSSRTGVPCPS